MLIKHQHIAPYENTIMKGFLLGCHKMNLIFCFWTPQTLKRCMLSRLLDAQMQLN